MGWVLTERQDRRRGAGLMLALLALLINILVPPGFMTTARGQGPGLVICSGHGPVSVALDDLAGTHKSPKSKPDAPCTFAGHGVAAAPTPAMAPAVQVFVGVPELAPVLADLTPGRGLAAPPPPSQAPPIDL